MRDTDKQIEVLKRILAASDEEAADYKFIYNCIAEYGVYPFEPLKEYYIDCNYTENGMMQVPAEFANFCCFISKWRIDSAIEIGVYRGRSSYLICALLYRRNPDLIYDMVDICDGLDEYERFAEVLPALRKRIPCTSNDFKGREYDFVFIDADHSYDGSILDYMNVGRFAKKLLCFHDIYAHECDSQNGGTVRMWKEVQNASSKSLKLTFSQFPDQWMGIGVCVNMFDSHMGYASDIEDLQKEIEQIKEFLKSGKEIFIYCASFHSKRLWKILRQEKTDISGFMISDSVVSENPDIIDEKRVVALSAVDIRDRAVSVVIPLRDGIAAQISAELINRGMEENRIYKVKERVLSHWFYGID